MRISFVIQRYGADVVGGAEKYVRDLARGLSADGHTVEVLTSCATSYNDWADVYSPGVINEEGVMVNRVRVAEPRPNERFIPIHQRVVNQMHRPQWPWGQQRWSNLMGPDLQNGPAEVAALAKRSDVVVMVGYHYAHTLSLTRSAAAHAPTVVVPTAHPEGAFFAGRVRQMFEYADLVICLSHAEADLVADVSGGVAWTTVVGCPVNPIPIPSDAEVDAAKAHHGLGEDPYLIVVGRIDPAKGSDEAIDHVQFVRRGAIPNLQLVVVGPGDLSGNTDGVIPTGFVSEAEKLALMRGATALLQPSHMESFSIALMEGWLLGRPALVQGTNAVLNEHIQRSGGGLAYTDVRTFETAAVALLGIPQLREDCAQAGKRYVHEAFDWQTVGPGFVHAMQEAVNRGTRRLEEPLSVEATHE